MDYETLRTILKAQTKAQQQMFTELMKRMGKMASASDPAVPTAPVATVEFVTNSLSTLEPPEFVYDPENGCTIEVWYNRYEDVISKDGATLDDAAKARLIVSKLDAVTYARFTKHILPKRACDVPLTDTVAVLKELFGHNVSVFTGRYAFLKTQRKEGRLRDYTGLVNQRHVMAELNDVTPEQMKCLVWICGLVALQDADVRARALRKMEDNPQTTLKELAAEVQHFLDIRQDATLLERSSVPHVNIVDSQKSRNCFRCGANHWSRDCSFVNNRCHDCRHSGHKRGFCKNFPEKKKRIAKQKRKSANTVTIASTRADVAVNRIYRRVQIDGKTVRMRLDTGAGVTLLSTADWTAMGRPKLQSPHLTLKSTNNEPINVRGCYECNFIIDGHRRYARATVLPLEKRLHLQHLFKDTQHLEFFSRNAPEEEVPSSLRSWTRMLYKVKG
ncbi:hypothetical protein RB195_023167 [Necator americanus]|uniref:DUF7083 domain-containing protein n=1 Tax=Necator americanus TaxID=51031 RepID=A0ABR1EI28_NECAM